jgi:hypothetical protein
MVAARPAIASTALRSRSWPRSLMERQELAGSVLGIAMVGIGAAYSIGFLGLPARE